MIALAINAFSYLCGHPAQQHGLRSPAFILLNITFILRSRVSDFTADSIQQIHSLRASGVMSSHIASILGVTRRIFLRSAGILWTVPDTIDVELIPVFYQNAEFLYNISTYMSDKPTIAVYIPRWLAHIDTGLTMFTNGLYNRIEHSDKYNLLKITSRMCSFKSIEEAQAFVQKHNIVFVMYHGTRPVKHSKTTDQGLDYLEQCIPFLNSKSVHVADDKFETKKILRDLGIPVLPDFAIKTRKELLHAMNEEELYVAKPHNAESGNGVKLIKRTSTEIYEYLDRSWQKITIRDTEQGLAISSSFGFIQIITICFFAAAFISLPFRYAINITNIFLCFGTLSLLLILRKMIKENFIYDPLMLEPFFGDGMDEFYCLRCTILDGKVIESAKKANTKNVTPNMSHGGIATKVVLSKEQEDIAIAAAQAVGAIYAGIDLLHANGKTIVCEVNVGPIGVYCEQTGVDVGGLLAEYAMNQTSLKRN